VPRPPPPETSNNQFLKPFVEQWQNLSNLAHFGSVSSFCGQGLIVVNTLVEGVVNASTLVEGVVGAFPLVEGLVKKVHINRPEQARTGLACPSLFWTVLITPSMRADALITSSTKESTDFNEFGAQIATVTQKHSAFRQKPHCFRGQGHDSHAFSR